MDEEKRDNKVIVGRYSIFFIYRVLFSSFMLVKYLLIS